MNENFYDASEAADEVVSEAASAPSAPSATSGAPSGAPSDSRQATPWPSAPAPRDDAIDLLLAHNSLRSLWALLRSEYLLTFPMGEASLGGLLKAEYRNPDDGAIRGMKTFVYERDLIVEYVVQVLQWWHGEREPAGVVEQEAYKCRNCDFNDDCAWRVEQEGRATERVREKLKEGEGRRRSRV
jgi:exonuclease V